MIIWSGLGFLVAVIVFVSSLLMEFVTEKAAGDDQFYQDSSWAFPAALILAAVLTFGCDLFLRAKSPGQHSLFFIPMKWWSPILVGIAIVVFAYNVAS